MVSCVSGPGRCGPELHYQVLVIRNPLYVLGFVWIIIFNITQRLNKNKTNPRS